MRRTLLLAALFAALAAAPALAAVKVVATLPWIGSLAREIGRQKIDLTVLVKPSEDPHSIEAKPSMVLAARKADILLYNGLDLEAGYLPVLIETSKNPKIQPGKDGNFDCSRFVAALEKPVSHDRSQGDVHPLGNPHYHLSPRNVARVAAGLADRLGRADPANAEVYRRNLIAFEERLKEKQREWSALPLRSKRYVAHHKFFEYLASEFGCSILGYVEAKPGIPPSAANVEQLLALISREKPDAILSTSFSPRKEVDFLFRKSGVRAVVVPADVGGTPEAKDWFSLMDQVLGMMR